MENYNIVRYCTIANNSIVKNGEKDFELKDETIAQFLDAIYQEYHISYPKFHKMDNLSKLGFLTAEVVLKDLTLTEKFDPYKIGVIVSNESSSLDTDLSYFNTVKKGIASPALFVYTLPNIVIGEICIRNGLKGENTFFISDKYEIDSQVKYVNSLLNNGVIDACICGWIELMSEKYESFLYLVVKGGESNQLQHTAENIKTVYHQIPN